MVKYSTNGSYGKTCQKMEEKAGKEIGVGMSTMTGSTEYLRK